MSSRRSEAPNPARGTADAAGVENRGLITAAIMLATLMITLDSTIANVALPHIQGSLSASPEQISWVLTSYIVAQAMVTPVSGWLANRCGIRTMFMITVAGFTLSSMLCGVAGSLPELVVFRLAQGGFGAFCIPLSQAVLLNINPRSEHARAMSMWAMGTILGPILGPVLGGYITEEFSWRWCFYINLPVGALALIGLWLFMPSERSVQARRFDFLGFGALIVGVAALQLMLDRGPGQDWFNSKEIWTEALLALAAAWIFLVHTATTAHPFIELSLLRDRNLVAASLFGFVLHGVMFGSLAILPLLMQSLMGYPVLTSGLVSTPRGLGMIVTICLAPRLTARIGLRMAMVLGMVFNALGLWEMSLFDLSMTSGPLMLANLLGGVAQGLIFVPMTTLAFATIRPTMRSEAAAFYNLVRTLGSSIGISIMEALATTNTQVMHASLAAPVRPDDPVFRWSIGRMFSPETAQGALALDADLNRQATMIAYLDDFRLMFALTLVGAPLIFLLRNKRVEIDPAHAVME